MPEGVQAVRKGSRVYYYYQERRGAKIKGKRIALGRDPADPEFWRKIRAARGAGDLSVDALISAYQTSPEWEFLRPQTRRDYTIYLNKLSAKAGSIEHASITRQDVYATRDAMAATPTSANHFLSVLQSLFEWGVARGICAENPVIKVKRLQIEADGAAPWPEEAYQYVQDHAPEDLRRMAFLGRAIGQRASDLCRACPAHLRDDGIRVMIGKLRERLHFVPLTPLQLDAIRSWGTVDLQTFLQSAAGKPYSADHLNSRWNRWRAGDGKALKDFKLTIHGLRATACCDRAMAGTPDNGIAAELGMSVQMVTRYTKHVRKADMARASLNAREMRAL